MADNSPDSLAELLDQARLGTYLPKARTTLFDDWGAVDVSEVTNDPQLVEELADKLELKRCERGRLTKAIATQQERVRDMKAIAAQQAKGLLPKDSIYV